MNATHGVGFTHAQSSGPRSCALAKLNYLCAAACPPRRSEYVPLNCGDTFNISCHRARNPTQLLTLSDARSGSRTRPDSADPRTLPLSPTFVRISVSKNLRCPPNVALHKHERRAQTPRHLLFDIVNHEQSHSRTRVRYGWLCTLRAKRAPIRRNAIRCANDVGAQAPSPARSGVTKKCGRGARAPTMIAFADAPHAPYTDEFPPVPPCFSTWGFSLASRKATGHGAFPHARAHSNNRSPCYSPC
jgi:hypothetical protein